MGAFSCISIALAFAADVTPPRHRGAVFGFIMGSFSFGVVVGAARCPALTAATKFIMALAHLRAAHWSSGISFVQVCILSRWTVEGTTGAQHWHGRGFILVGRPCMCGL